VNATDEIHSDRRLPSLTGLRIFAALAVYLSHIGPPHGSPQVLYSFFEAGYAGVTIFFVLSGFVLAVNYFDEFRRLRLASAWNFFVARFARLYPLYLLILFYLVVRQHALGIPIDGWWRNALAIQTWNPHVEIAYSFDSPAWSIGVEFFLYACFPLLVPLIARLRSARSILLCAAAVAAAMFALAAIFVASGHGWLPATDPDSAHRWLYRTPLTRLGDFALGILAARLFVVVGRERLARFPGAALAVVAALVILVLMCWHGLLFSAWSWDVAYAVPAAFLIFGLATAPRGTLARFLSIPAIVLLGEASYAFYLVHFPMISFLGAGSWVNSMTATELVYEALILGAIVALSIGLHVGFELPARRKLRHWLSWDRGAPRKRPPEPTPPG
jgi:peptidoglycan/LPS O-acetylase OafA/YrhL